MSSNNKDLGIIAPKLLNDEKTTEIISFCKEYFSNNPYNQVCLFNSFCDRISCDNIPILHLSQAKFFYGQLIVSDIKDLDLSLSFPNVYKTLFFCSNIPWENEIRNYKEWENIFYNEKVEIVAHNQKIYDLFSLFYKKPITTMQGLKYDKIQQYL